MRLNITLVFFLALLAISLCQDECEESRLQKIQTGQILLNPNDLGSAGANKNYIESLTRGNFGPSDVLSHAFAIAGFQTSCAQNHYSLLVDIVEPQSENTRLKIIVDFRNRKGDALSTWTRVKLSYLVTSAQRRAPNTQSAYIWATSQYVDLTTGAVTGKAIFTDPLFTSSTGAANDFTRGQGCGLIYDTANNRYKFGIRCDETSTSDGIVTNDVVIHAYIMGFQYAPDAGKNGHFMAATTKWNSWMSADTQRELAFYKDASTANDRSSANYGITFKYDVATGGPIFSIQNFSGELQGIKVAIVMSVINPSYGSNAAKNGIDAKLLSYSYSGIYTVVDPKRYNIKSIIDQDKTKGWNNLHQRLPVNKFMIYGLSSFQLKDGSSCISFNIDVSIDSVNSLTVRMNQASFVENVVIQGDIYFPQIVGVCTPVTEFSKVAFTNTPSFGPSAELTTAIQGGNSNLRYIKTKSSERYEETPSDERFKKVIKITDSPLEVSFVSFSRQNIVENVRFYAQINMTGLTDGKPYGINFLLVPSTTRPNKQFPDPSSSTQTYDFEVLVNGFRLFKKQYKGDYLELLAAKPASISQWEQNQYGININGNTARFQFNVIVPRDSTSNNEQQTFNLALNLFEFVTVYDPVSQCCVSRCPPKTGLDVSATPVACVVCDASKGLTFDSSTSSCTCAEGNYLNDNLGFQCFPCEAKLCSTCTAAKPTVCSSCITGAMMSRFDNSCSCSSGFFETNGTCRKCPARCATCTIPSTCDTCADTNRNINNNCLCNVGFYDAGVDKCVACNSNCVTCENRTTCSSCDSRRFRTLQSGLCLCQRGYFELIFQNGTRVCRPCSRQCETCVRTATECTSCDDTVNRIEGYDSLGRKTCICKAGYRSLNDSSCIQSNCKSDKWCSQCEKNLALCVQCQTSAKRIIKLPEHICVCQDGFFEGPDGLCRPCGEGCARCSSLSRCQTCIPQAINNNNGTCTCATGLFHNTLTNLLRLCQSCPNYCNRCTDALTCVSCKAGFQLSTANLCLCPNNNFINSRNDCVPCRQGCEVCNSNTTCNKCISPLVLQQNNCITRCSEGYFLESGRCVNCPANCIGCTSNNKCFFCSNNTLLSGGLCYATCPSGTIANRQTFVCTPCNSPCRTCVNHPSSCTSCDPGEGFLQMTGNSSSCVKQCAEGTFAQNGVCQVCDFRCAKCLGSAKFCIACPTGRYLFNGACWDFCPGIMVNNSCSNVCPQGYFRVNDRQCKQCSTECSTCDSNSTCLTCANKFLSLNGKCVRNCTEGFFVFRGMCVACDRSCRSCRNIPTQCTQCADGFFNSNGICVRSCAQGTFLDPVSRSCRACFSLCRTCSAQRNCLTCPNEKIIPIGGQCLSCIYPCANCSADLSQCFSCVSGFYLSNGDCLRNCPSGTRPVNGVCSCASGLFFKGSCVSVCPSGFTRVANQCRRCQSPCVECSGSPTFCTDCLDTFTLIRNTGRCNQSSGCNYGQIQDEAGRCQRVCGENLFLLNRMCIFGRCPDGFRENGFGGCMPAAISNDRCDRPLFRQNDSCVNQCGNSTFANMATRTCESCVTRCQVCLSRDYCLECVTGFAAVDGRCLARAQCQAPQISDNWNCVDLCPLGKFASEGRCLRRCPQGSFFWNGLCYDTCPPEARLFTDHACVGVCPRGTNLIDGVCATLTN